jgi:hypothetical protein
MVGTCMVALMQCLFLKQAYAQTNLFSYPFFCCRWKKLELIVQLMQPIMDAIHQLEADKALLSQVVVEATLTRIRARARTHTRKHTHTVFCRSSQPGTR